LTYTGATQFEKVSSNFPAGLPEAISFAILTKKAFQIIITDVSQVKQKVAVVRLIRSYCSLTLSEAVKLFDHVSEGNQTTIHIDPINRVGFVNELSVYGVTVY
jgi:ribosomal protein L7/L12